MIIILLVVTVQLLLRKNNFMVIRLKYKILIITLIFVALLSLSNVCAVDVNLSEDDVVLNDTHYKNINLAMFKMNSTKVSPLTINSKIVCQIYFHLDHKRIIYIFLRQLFLKNKCH